MKLRARILWAIALGFNGIFPVSNGAEPVHPRCQLLDSDLSKIPSRELHESIEDVPQWFIDLASRNLQNHFDGSKIQFLGRGVEGVVFRLKRAQEEPFLVKVFRDRDRLETAAHFLIDIEDVGSNRIKDGFVDVGFKIPVIEELPKAQQGFKYRNIQGRSFLDYLSDSTVTDEAKSVQIKKYVDSSFEYLKFIQSNFKLTSDVEIIFSNESGKEFVSSWTLKHMSREEFQKLIPKGAVPQFEFVYQRQGSTGRHRQAIEPYNLLLGDDGPLYLLDLK